MSEDVRGGSQQAIPEAPSATPHLPDTLDRSDLKRQSVRGGAAVVMAQITGMALQLGTMFVLARLLSATDYGLQSMVVTLTAFFSLFKDAGLSVAAVQRDKLTHEDLSTLFWINLGLGLLLTLAVAALAPAVAAFYREPRLLWLTIVSSTVFFLNSLAVQHKALLDRSMRFVTATKIDILCNSVGTVVAIGLASLGFGYWALILQTVSLPIVGTIAAWIVMPWIPGRPRWSPELRSMVRFGSTVTFNTLVVYIAYNTEKVLLGRYWGAASLGIYGRAYQLATLPVQQLINAVHTVAFAALSRMQNDAERLRRSYLQSLSLIVSLTVPTVIASSLFADEIVAAILGPKWAQVAILLRLLSPTVLVLALLNPFSWFLRATGQVGRSLKTAFLICPMVIIGVLAGLRRGPSGVAFGYSAAMVVVFLPVVLWATHGTGITLTTYWEAVKRPLTAGVLGGAVGWGVHTVCRRSLGVTPLLTMELGVSGVVYALILTFAMGQKDVYVDLFRQLARRRREAPSVV